MSNGPLCEEGFSIKTFKNGNDNVTDFKISCESMQFDRARKTGKNMSKCLFPYCKAAFVNATCPRAQKQPLK